MLCCDINSTLKTDLMLVVLASRFRKLSQLLGKMPVSSAAGNTEHADGVVTSG